MSNHAMTATAPSTTDDQRNPGTTPTGSVTHTVLAVLTQAGVAPQTLADARLQLAQGEVFASTHRAAHEQHASVADTLDILQAVARRIADGQSLAPLIELAAKTETVRHYPWCAGACETEQYDDGTVTTAHYGADTDLPVPEGMHPADGILLRAGIGADENWTNPAPSLYLQSGGAGTALDATGTDQLIADLDAFTTRLRALRAQMEQGPRA